MKTGSEHVTGPLILSAVSVLLGAVCSPAAVPEVHVDAGKVVGSIRSVVRRFGM